MIRGWFPALVSGWRQPQQSSNPTNNDLESPHHSWFTHNLFGDDLHSQTLYLGTWSVNLFTLQRLYKDHKQMRNRWSTSNCGYDLAKYHGTLLTFIPHVSLDYIVYIDTEYKSVSAFMKQPLHPGVVITHPNTRIIKSRNWYKTKRFPTIWVPRPNHWTDQWYYMDDAANSAMFIIYISWIDLNDTFLPTSIGIDENAFKWWQPDPEGDTGWVKEFKKLQDNSLDAHLSRISYAQMGGTGQPSTHKLNNKYVDYGPFIIKRMWPESKCPTIAGFYKSYWTWGGNVVSLKPVCDPNVPW